MAEISPRDALATLSKAIPELRATWDDHLVLQECLRTLLLVVDRDEKKSVEEAPAADEKRDG
jgi:hypothetical protein